MSRKIYNEIILQWNEENNNYDTLYEDSYDYDGPLHLAQGMDGDDIDMGGIENEFAETWDTVSKNLSKKLVTEFKKTSKNTATQFDKDFARVAGKLTVYLKASVKAGNMGESIAREMGEAIEGVMSGMGDPADLRGQAAVMGEIGDKAGEINQFLMQQEGLLSDAQRTGLKGGLAQWTAAQNLTAEYAALADDAQKQHEWVKNTAGQMGLSVDAAEKLIKHIEGGGKVGKHLGDTFSGLEEDLEGLANSAELKKLTTDFSSEMEQGVVGALDMVPDNAVTRALGLDKAIGEGAKVFTDQFKERGAKIAQFLSKNWKMALGAGLMVGMFMKLAEQTDQIGENFGAIGVNEFQTDLMSANATAIGLGYGFEEVKGSVNALTGELGIGIDEASILSETTMETAKALGMGTDEAAKLTAELMNVAGHSAESASNFLKQTAALAQSAGVAPGAVLEDMAGASEEIASYSKDGGENMATAAVKARQMGMSLADTAKIADGLLDFQSSLEAEMTASVMIGRELNLQRARELSLAGDLVGMQDEILKQVGSEAEFNEMNTLQRKALADAMGVEVSQLSKMVATAGKSNAELMRMGELDISQVVGEDAVSGITLLTQQMKMFGQYLMVGLGWLTGWTEAFGNIGGPIATAVIVALVAFGGYVAVLTAKTYGQALANKFLAKSIDKVTAAEAKKKLITDGAPPTPGGKGGFKMPKLPSAKSMLQGAAAILVLSAALFVTAKAFQEFGSVEWSAVGKGLVGIVGLATIAVVLGAIGGPMLAGAFAIGVLSLALVPMAYAFSLIQDVGIGTMMGFAATLSVLAVAAAGLGLISPFIIAGSAALLILSTSLIPTTYALSLLAGVDTGMLTSLSSTLLSLGSSMALLGVMTPFIVLGSYALMIMSGAFAVFGGAMNLLAPGLQTIVPALTQMGSVLGQLIPQIAGINMLSLSMSGLAGSLFMLGTAGLFAAPALALLGGTGLIGNVMGDTVGGGTETGIEGPSENELLKAELVEIKNHLKTLVTGFGDGPSEKGYLTAIGQETAKGIGNAKITAQINKGL